MKKFNSKKVEILENLVKIEFILENGGLIELIEKVRKNVESEDIESIKINSRNIKSIIKEIIVFNDKNLESIGW